MCLRGIHVSGSARAGGGKFAGFGRVNGAPDALGVALPVTAVLFVPSHPVRVRHVAPGAGALFAAAC